MWVKLTCRAGIAALTMLTALLSRAETAPLDLAGAIERALAGNPDLALLRHQRDAQSGRVVQAGLRPNPELQLTVENFLGNGLYHGTNLMETTLSLAWVLERGKRDRRVDAAEAGLDHLEMEAGIQRLDVAGRTTAAFLSVLHGQERLRQAEAALALGDQVVEAVRAQVQAARSPTADLDRVQADRVWLELAREEAEHLLLIERRKLAASWGSREVDFEILAGDLYTLPDAGSFEALLARLAENPRINVYLTEQRVREAEVALAEAQARPDWRVNAGVRHFSVEGDGALVAGINLPLAFNNRNQGRIAEARALAAMAEDGRTATRLRIETALYGFHQELVHNLHRFRSIRQNLLPLVERMVGDAQRAYEIGRYGYFDLRLAQERLLDARAALLEEAYYAHLNRAEIERLTGMPLSSSASPSTAESQGELP